MNSKHIAHCCWDVDWILHVHHKFFAWRPGPISFFFFFQTTTFTHSASLLKPRDKLSKQSICMASKPITQIIHFFLHLGSCSFAKSWSDFCVCYSSGESVQWMLNMKSADKIQTAQGFFFVVCKVCMVNQIHVGIVRPCISCPKLPQYDVKLYV